MNPEITEKNEIVFFLKEIDKNVFKSAEYFALRLNEGMLPKILGHGQFDAIRYEYEHTISKPPLIKPDNKVLKNLLESAPTELGESLGNCGDVEFTPLGKAVITLIYMALLNHNQGGIESLFLLSQKKLLIDAFCYRAVTVTAPLLKYDFDRLVVLAEFNPGFLNSNFEKMFHYSPPIKVNAFLFGSNLNEAAYYVALGARQANLDDILSDPGPYHEKNFSLSCSNYDNAICYAEDYRYEISSWIQKVLLAHLIKTVTGYLGENIYSLPFRYGIASYQPKPLFFPNIGLPLAPVQMILSYVEGERAFLSEETGKKIQKISTCPVTTFAARQNRVVTCNTVTKTPGMDK